MIDGDKWGREKHMDNIQATRFTERKKIIC